VSFKGITPIRDKWPRFKLKWGVVKLGIAREKVVEVKRLAAAKFGGHFGGGPR
jgi:hypothetical protein